MARNHSPEEDEDEDEEEAEDSEGSLDPLVFVQPENSDEQRYRRELAYLAAQRRMNTGSPENF